AILFWVFDLFADFSVAAALPDHGRCRWRKFPARRPRGHVQSGQVLLLVTRGTFFRRHTAPVHSASHIHRMRMTIVALARKLSGRVAIQTARMAQHRREGAE